MAKCAECNKDYMETPDDSVYYTGNPYPELGIYYGMPYKKLIPILLQTMPAQGASDPQQVTAIDVAIDNPPAFLVTDFNGCWDKVSDEKGWYLLTAAAGVFTFSYDFTEAINTLPSSIHVKMVNASISVMENGVKKNLLKTEKASNAVVLEASNFPISLSVSINISSVDCSDMILYANLSLGNIPFADKRFFPLSVRGVNSTANSRYTLQDIINMSNAKLAQVTNFVDTVRAGDYLHTINLLALQNEALLAKVNEQKTYTIGDGLAKLTFTEEKFMAYVVNELQKMKDKIAKL